MLLPVLTRMDEPNIWPDKLAFFVSGIRPDTEFYLPDIRPDTGY
jgi:hypothetical protein